jgi:NADPH:quinone reductase-like Zn-dependent oxidoreductase
MNMSTIERPVDLTSPTDGPPTMKAIVQDVYGPPEVLELREIDKPSPGDGDVLVRVRGASVNPADWRFMRGSPFALRMAGNGLRTPKHPVLGIDVSGVVEAVGKDVTGVRVGDEVMGWCRGSYAEYVCAAEDHFVPKPANITFEQAAAVPLAAIAALQGLRNKGHVEPGHRVLIVGASGGVGTFAVQIAKALGAEVTGVCSTRNVEMVQSIGAEHVIDYATGDFVGGAHRYDLILQLAGTRSPSDCRRTLKPKGTLVLSSGDGRANGMGRMFAATVTSPFVSQRLVTWVSKQNKSDLLTVSGFIEAGQVRPIIDRTYPLNETAAAVRYVEAGHTRGKVVITV